ncbi:MAG: class I SAM-dependent methyltransferase [Anaerolineales bacterium]|nr:MAG: class I SAM-dependent methyltransferase [Anaerolineales bacterium]
MTPAVWIGVGLWILGLLAYWELWICEGTHLGQRFVVWLYDLAATRYEDIKQFDTLWERRFLAEPVEQVLGRLPDARVLDVGAGTGRLARGLLQLPGVQATVICLEPSARMAALGVGRTPDKLAPWLRAWAVPLPFPDETFDMVSSLEILEFTPRPMKTLAELIRVLRPGGWLMVTNRVGWEAPLILGKTYPRQHFPGILTGLGLVDVEDFRWQMTYDLIWGRKPYPQEAQIL